MLAGYMHVTTYLKGHYDNFKTAIATLKEKWSVWLLKLTVLFVSFQD